MRDDTLYSIIVFILEVFALYCLISAPWVLMEQWFDGGVTTSNADGVIGLVLAISLRSNLTDWLRRIRIRRFLK
jgi:hypothetical protein